MRLLTIVANSSLAFLLAGIAVATPSQASGQGAYCPPSMPSIYDDPVFGWFSGTSTRTGVGVLFVSYKFTGVSDDLLHGISGTHDVAVGQCQDAWFQTQVLKIPAVIINLHNKVVTARNPSGGGDGCDYQVIYEEGTTCRGGDGTAGGGDDQSSSLCVDLYLDPGCYDVYVDDFYEGTICC